MNIIASNIVGKSQLIEDMKNAINTMAQYPAPVLVTGETGVGKDLVARALHYGGKYVDKPFIALNCSTFSDELFVSELFGYKKGAFTDAKNDKEGLLVSAVGGTIFLDEIDCLSLKSQAALLRVLQESEFRPIGSNVVLKTNVRFIAATNCSLEEKINKGTFRQDLYFRLFILSVKVPTLRDRKQDIELLIGYFIQKLNIQYGLNKKGISTQLLDKFKLYHWPGNVRELENTIHRYYLLTKGELLIENSMLEKETTCDISKSESIALFDHEKTNHVHMSKLNIEQEIRHIIQEESGLPDDLNSDCINFTHAKRHAIESFEAKFVSRLLKFTNGNVTKAAGLCGKERRSFGKLVKKYNIKNNEIIVY